MCVFGDYSDVYINGEFVHRCFDFGYAGHLCRTAKNAGDTYDWVYIDRNGREKRLRPF